MPSSQVTQLIGALCRISYTTSFTTIPFLCKISDNTFYVSKNISNKQVFLHGIHFITLLITIAQFFLNLFESSKENVVGILFYGFVFILTTATGIYGFGFYLRASEFCCLLNILVQNPNGLLNRNRFNVRPNGKRFQNMLLFTLIVFAQFTTAITFLVFFPLMDLTLAIVSPNSNFVFILFSKYFESTNLLNAFLVLIKLPTYFIACLIGFLSIPIMLIFIKELLDNLKDLRQLLTKNRMIKSENADTLIEIYYRQIQVFVILVNECLQTHFWPVVEFIGAVVSIGLAYTFIRYHGLFNIYVQGSLAAASISVFLLLCVMFDVGSQSLLISSKIIRWSTSAVGRDKTSKLFRKFAKSCPPVVLKVGNFHRIDRQRGPALIRFIVQRTVFLLLKS